MRITRWILAALVGALVVLPGAASVGAQESSGFEEIRLYDVKFVIEEDGSVLVIETIDYDFGFEQRHGIFRDIPVRENWEPKAHHDRVYPLEVVSVRATEGTPAQYKVETHGNTKRIKIGDPDRTITGVHGYEITYRLEHALNGFEDHDELVWDAIGADWALIIEQATVSVEAPGQIISVLCTTGPVRSETPCDNATSDGNRARFTQAQIFPFQAMTVSVAFPKGLVPAAALEPELEERWHWGRAFELSTVNVGGGIALLVAVVGAVGGLVWVKGRDRRYKGSAVDAAFGSADAEEELVPLGGEDETPVEFVPPDDLRPGQVGTLVDFRAHPLDVTATIVDLAVRGYLTIEEIPGGTSKPDWKLTKKKEPGDELEKYEQKLIEGLFRNRGDTVELSDLRYKFAARMGAVQKALNDDAMEKGWFTKRPDGVSLGAGCLGFFLVLGGAALTVLAIVFTRWAFIPIPIVIGGLLLMVAARWLPARTAKGYAVLRRTNGFRRFIEESEKERAQFAERKNLFSEYLPYAIVFGATDKWARAFSGLDDQLPDTASWYVGTTPFSVATFSHSIDGFTVSSAGTLTSSPPSTSSSSTGSSGFSGGGFSGGGGGGGGGGSW